jgi:general secretion pathway protein L
MTVLVVQIPPRPRAYLRDGATVQASTEGVWQLLDAPSTAMPAGSGPVAEWPAADSLVLVLPPQDVGWQRVSLPKAPAGRLRQALLGVLEDQLLADDDDLHFALPPEPVAGQPTWVAVTQRAWLADWLRRLEAAGRPVDRVVPSVSPAPSPGLPPLGHFERPADAEGDDSALQLTWADTDGVLRLGLGGSLARAHAARAAASTDAQWSATPASAAAAEAWLGRPVTVLGEAELARQRLASPWNLRQFDLAPRHRGASAFKEGWRRFVSPAWRPVHVGLAALLVINLVGLNAWAWQQQRALTERKQAMLALLRSTHPQVRAVLDAPLQMARETERLRAAAGQPGDTDIETLLAVAAAAWPSDEPPTESLQFEPGRLVLAVDAWDDARLAAFRDQVAPAGWAVSGDGTRLTLSRAPARDRSAP